MSARMGQGVGEAAAAVGRGFGAAQVCEQEGVLVVGSVLGGDGGGQAGRAGAAVEEGVVALSLMGGGRSVWSLWGVAALCAFGLFGGAHLAWQRFFKKRIEARSSKRRNDFLQAACDGDIDKLVECVREGQDLSCADKNGSNALMLAAWAGRRESVLILLHSGADVHAVSDHGWTALTYAARAGEADTVETLLEWGAEVNVVEMTTGATPLMFAAYVGSLECVELLLDAGADPLVRTRQGALPFAFAEENGHDGIAGMLRHRAADALAESQALKERDEAVLAREKAIIKKMQRKKQEQAYVQQIEELRKRAAQERAAYQSSFSGQLEMLSVGCYIKLDHSTVQEIVRVLLENKWELPLRSPRRPKRSSVAKKTEFELLHRELLQRRALNALARPMLKDDANPESDSEEEEEEDEDDEGEEEQIDDHRHATGRKVDWDQARETERGKAGHVVDEESHDEKDTEPMLTAAANASPPMRLIGFLTLVLPVLSTGATAEDSERPRLRAAANAVSFRGSDQLTEMEKDPGNVDVINSLRILNGLGGMASSYLESLRPKMGHESGARTHMPYFLQVEPEVFALLAQTLVKLVQLREVPARVPPTLLHETLCSFLAVVQAHLSTISLLRLETTRGRDALAVLGDALLLVALQRAAFGTDTLSPHASSSDAFPVNPDGGTASAASFATASAGGVGGGAPVSAKGELDSTSIEDVTQALPTSASAVVNQRTLARRGTILQVQLSERPHSTELSSHSLEQEISGSADVLAAQILTRYLRVLSRSTFAEAKFLSSIWKRSRSNKAKAMLRRFAAEAMVGERAISYLVCQAPDTPRPTGDVASGKRRLARVLGIHDTLDQVRPSPRRGQIGDLRRNRSNIEHVERPSQVHLKRARFSSITRRESLQNRVRVRSVLGEGAGSAGIDKSAAGMPGSQNPGAVMKRRSQGLLSMHRTSRSFIYADTSSSNLLDREEASRNAARKSKDDTSLPVGDVQGNGDSDVPQEVPAASSRNRRSVTLEEVETCLLAEDARLVSGRVPMRILAWIEDTRPIVTSESPRYARAMFDASEDGPPPVLDAETKKIPEMVPGELSISRAPSTEQASSGKIDLFSTFLQAVLDEDDSSSAVLLRCIQDDLISRLLVLFQARKLNSERGAQPLTPVHPEHVEEILLKHCRDLFAGCVEKLNRHDPIFPYRRREAHTGEEGSRWLVEDVACELMERLAILADWSEGGDALSPILLDIVHGSKTPGYMKTCATKLLCNFARHRLRSQEFRASLDDPVEHLLHGPLFARPSNVDATENETTEVFLQDLARSPAKPVHQSDAQALHALISSKPELRLLTTQAKGKPPVLEDVVRISAAAYLQHTGTAELAFSEAKGLSAEKLSPARAARVDHALVQIWKTAWETTRSIVSVYRASQRKVCSMQSCSRAVVEEESGAWRCEVGHVCDEHDVEEIKSYQEICAEVAARARILLGQGAAMTEQEDSWNAALQHAKRFIESAASDDIDADKLELYLKAKSRFGLYRSRAFGLVRDVLASVYKLKTQRKEPGQDDRAARDAMRKRIVQAAARTGQRFSHAGTLRTQTSFDNEAEKVLGAGEIEIDLVLQAVRDMVESLPRERSLPGHHPLDFQMPSPYSASIQAAYLEIFDLVLRVAEETSSSEELADALKTLQVLSIRCADHDHIEALRIAPRLVALVESTNEAFEESPFLANAAWSVFARFGIQTMLSSWLESSRWQGKLGRVEIAVDSDTEDEGTPWTGGGFNDVQQNLALTIHAHLSEAVATMRDNKSPTYDRAEMQCYRFVSLLGTLCCRSVVAHHFSQLLNETEHAQENLVLLLISCPSPRIQQLGIRLGRKLLWYCEGSMLAAHLFHIAGSWALSLKGYTSAGRSSDLALECAGMLRFLAGRGAGQWRDAVLETMQQACEAFVADSVRCSHETLFRVWTSLAILDMSSPPTLRPGCRVKLVPGRGFSGWNESKSTQEYGIVIRTTKRLWSSSVRPGASGEAALAVSPFADAASCMLVLDSEPAKLPTKLESEKVIPVTIMLEGYQDFFSGFEQQPWLLDMIELFSQQFWASKSHGDLLWYELRTMSMSVLHTWLSADPAHAIPQIISRKPAVWRNIVSICACPTPLSSLENVDDLASSTQAFSDLKVVLCEMGTCPLDLLTVSSPAALGTSANAPVADKPLAKKLSNGVKGEDAATTRAVSPTPSSPSSADEEEEEQQSLLSQPLLQPGRRAELARQASTQMFSSSGGGKRLANNSLSEPLDLSSAATPAPPQRRNTNPESTQTVSPISDALASITGTSSSSSSSNSTSRASSELHPPVRGDASEEREPPPAPVQHPPQHQTLRRGSAGSVTRLDRRSNSGTLGSVTIGANRGKKTVKFEPPSRIEMALMTPFQEMDRGDQSTFAFELQVERNRKRARQERKRRAARRLRTLSSTSAAFPPGSGPLENGGHDLSREGRAGSLSLRVQGPDGPMPSLCQPDTPRGRDATALPLPVELPTVDTMLSVPVSTMSSKVLGKKDLRQGNNRAVVREGTLLRISPDETGVVEFVQLALNGTEVAYVHIFNSQTGFQSASWYDIAELELSEDVIADRYRLTPRDRWKSSSSSSSSATPTLSSSESSTSKVKSKLARELRYLCTRSAILNARRAAVAAISGSLRASENLQMQLLVGEAGGASQILGMLKLCESSSSSDSSHDLPPSVAHASTLDQSQGLWKAVAVLFDTNEEFADMLLNEAILYLSTTAKDTLLFETPHPLCPIEALGPDEDDMRSNDDLNSYNESAEELSLPSTSIDAVGGRVSPLPDIAVVDQAVGTSMERSLSQPGAASSASSSSPPRRLGSDAAVSDPGTSSPLPPPPLRDDAGFVSQAQRSGSASSSHFSVGSDAQSLEYRNLNKFRKLSGSHRFFITGATGLLVEFDRRSSVLSDATQVTLSYDPQDRDVIKVLGEGGADAWQPVVVSGDTCYIHWNVNQSEITGAIQRMEELSVDLDEVAWGVAIRVRRLEETSNADEMQVLERPFGWRLMQVIAENPERALTMHESGITFFNTAISYLRSENLAFKSEICEVLTLIVQAQIQRVKAVCEATALSKAKVWDDVMRTGLYKLHHDLLLLFDEIAEDGFMSVSPYFVCLLELLVLCRDLWALQAGDRKTNGKDGDIDNKTAKAPLCSLVVFGRREHSKVVMDCETCNLVDDQAVCLACAATCHVNHRLRNERTTSAPCGCSLRGPESCSALRPFADMWRISAADRTWFDVVCQTADVIDCVSGDKQRPIPLQFVHEAYRTCEDGKLLRLCLRSLEECLKSEVQEPWWDREARHMWANMLDQGMDSVAEIAFGLKVLVSSLVESAFVPWWNDRKADWLGRIHTNQAWELAQAMLQFNFALSPNAYYEEWDGRLHNWSTTLSGIAGLGGPDNCTYLLTGEFPRPQVYVKCHTCNMELCELCALRHGAQGHDLSEETYGPGFCDERTEPTLEQRKPRFEMFSQVSSANFDELHDMYWTNHDSLEIPDDQLPTEPRTLAALLNVPHNVFSSIEEDQQEAGMTSPLIACAPPDRSNLLSPCLLGILIELLGVKEDSDFLCVSCDADHGFALSVGALLTTGCHKETTARIHGIASSRASGLKVCHNVQTLRETMGVPVGLVEVFNGDLLAHARAVSSFGEKERRRHHKSRPVDPKEPPKVQRIEGMLPRYDRILCNGVVTMQQLDALSAMLPLDGALLCPMVYTLGYGIYVQRNQFTGECENRTLAPLYEDSESFLDEIDQLHQILEVRPASSLALPRNPQSSDPRPEEAAMAEDTDEDTEALEMMQLKIEVGNQGLQSLTRERAELFSQISECWDLSSWNSLADFASRLAGRDTASLGFRDISADALEAFPLLQQVENLDVVRGRFAVLKRVNDSLSEVLPLINLTPQYSAGGIGKQLAKSNTKRIIFLSTKLDAWSKVLESTWSDAPPAAMPSIMVSRALANLGLPDDSLFMQTYNQVQNYPPSALRRRDQSFKVRFAGERGQDLGGLYRDLFSEMCIELREGRPAILFQPPLMSKVRGEPLLPRPSLNSPVDLRLYEFLGSLVGISCMRHGATMSLDISPLVWKALVKDTLVEGDLRYVDEVALQAVSFIRRALREEIEEVFRDTAFAAVPSDSLLSDTGNPSSSSSAAAAAASEDTEALEASDGEHAANRNGGSGGTASSRSQGASPETGMDSDVANSKGVLVELCPLGKERKVTPDNAQEYAMLLEAFRLTEAKAQIDAMQRGIVPLVPARLLPMFTWQELESLCCGVADVDIEFLHSKTKYVGGLKVTDKSVKFLWDVLANDFTPEDRTQFLRFVWGRERMSAADDGATFVIGPHIGARESDNPDKFLPLAHTCFFSLDWPPYSSREVTKSRLLFAINNCNAIDADDTGEGFANSALAF